MQVQHKTKSYYAVAVAHGLAAASRARCGIIAAQYRVVLHEQRNTTKETEETEEL